MSPFRRNHFQSCRWSIQAQNVHLSKCQGSLHTRNLVLVTQRQAKLLFRQSDKSEVLPNRLCFNFFLFNYITTLARIETAVDQTIFVFVERVTSANVIRKKLAEISCCFRSTILLAHRMNTKRLERVGQITFIVEGTPACYPAIFAILNISH